MNTKKKCTLCQNDFPKTEFNKKKTSKDGLQSVCRTCNSERSKKYYNENKEKHLKVIYKNRKKYMGRARDLILEAKSEGCVLCEETEVVCMDLHHVDQADKEFNLGDVATGFITSPKRILNELSKCVCVCSNCHRKIHAGLLELPEQITSKNKRM